MTEPFVHTFRALQTNSGRAASLGLGALLLVTIAWISWLFYAHVTVYEVSKKTRLEVAGATFPIHSEVAGKLAAVKISLGQRVHAGDLLFQLDTSVEEQRLRTVRARLAAVQPQLDVATTELAATLDAAKAEVDTAMAAVREARARDREARIRGQLANREAARFRKLEGYIAPLEIERVTADARMREASSQASSLHVQRLFSDQRSRQKAGEVRTAALRRELATLTGEQQVLVASVAELEQIIARRQIRAPSSGWIGDLLPIHPGFYVAEGAKLATLMPLEELILVAEFDPADALGRIKPEQHAQLRLTGFPWFEFGVVPARVIKVASEVHDGLIRVEMALLRNSQPLIPFQHGLPGTVEVEVERVTPARLMLRGLGRYIDRFDPKPF